MSVNKVSIGVVGAGYWGPNLIRNLSALPSCEVRYICDQRQERLDQIGKNFPNPKLTTDFSVLLNDAELDAIVVATPVSTHEKLAHAALEAGKHVLIEKPLTADVESSLRLVNLAAEKNVKLMVGHTFEYNSAVRQLKEIIADPDFGDVVYAYSRRVNLGILREDVNALWNLAPHDVSILLYLFDEFPSHVTAHGLAHVQPNVEDVVFVYLHFPSGRAAHVHVSWLDPSKSRGLTVIGSRQMAIYDDLDAEARLKIYDRGFEIEPVTSGIDHANPASYTFRTRAGDIICPHVAWKEPLSVECRHFIDSIREDTTPISDGASGLRVVSILEAATTSMREHGRRVEVAMPELKKG